MCWITKLEPIKQVAIEDIPVFKIVHKSLRSIYYNFEYELDKEYSTTMNCHFDIITEGFHSYSSEKVRIEIHGDFIQILGGPHYLDWFTDDVCAMECVIPKGAVYFQNERGELVSNKIKPINVKKIKGSCVSIVLNSL